MKRGSSISDATESIALVGSKESYNRVGGRLLQGDVELQVLQKARCHLQQLVFEVWSGALWLWWISSHVGENGHIDVEHADG